MAADKETYRGLSKTEDLTGVLSAATQRVYLGTNTTSDDTDAVEVAKQLADATAASGSPPVPNLELYDTRLTRPGSNTIEIVREFRLNNPDNERINSESYAQFTSADNFTMVEVTPLTVLATDTRESLANDHWFGVRARIAITMSGGTSGSITAVTVNYGGKGYTGTPIFTVNDGAGHTAVLTATVGTKTATGTATITGTAISAVVITNPGGSYSGAIVPTFTGNGTGAVGYAVLDVNGAVQSVIMTNPGSGYTTCAVTFPTVTGVITSVAVTSTSGGFTFVPRPVIPWTVEPLFTNTRIDRMVMRKVSKLKAYMTVTYSSINSPARVSTHLFEGSILMKRELVGSGPGTWTAYVYVAACYNQSTTGGTKYTLYLTPQYVHWPYRRIVLRQNLYTDRVFTSNWTPNTVLGGELGGDFSQFIGSVNSTLTTFTKHPSGYLKYTGGEGPETDIVWEGSIVRSAMMEYTFEENPRNFVNPVGWRSVIEGVDSIPTGSLGAGQGWVDISAITVNGIQVLGAEMPALANGGPFSLL